MSAAGRAEAGRVGGWLFVLALSVYLFTAGGSMTITDAVVMFDVTQNIVEHHTVAMSGSLLGMEAHRGADGRYYSPFGIAQSIYNVPFYLAAKLFAGSTRFRLGKSDSVPKAFVALGQTLLGAVIVWQTFRLSTLVTGNVIAATLAALTLAFGSLLWPYARFGFNQPLACATLLESVIAALNGVRTGEPRYLVASSVWISASLMTRHEMALGALPVAALLTSAPGPSGRRWRRVAAFAPGLIGGVALWLFFNAIRFGNPLDAGYMRDPSPEFGSSVIGGLLGLLFSPSASVLLFSPFAVLGFVGLRMLSKEDRLTAGFLVSLVTVFLVLYATLGNWLGGRSYGSRYLIVVLPYLAAGFAVLLAGLSGAAHRLVFAAALFIGIIVQIPGVLVDYAKVSQSVAAVQGGFTTPERQWDWRASALFLNARAMLTAVPANISYVLGTRTPPGISPPASDADRGFSQQFAFSLDFWWLYLFYLHVLPRPAVFVLMTMFVAWVSFCAWRVHRALSGGPTNDRSW
jgi:hypothetical protein